MNRHNLIAALIVGAALVLTGCAGPLGDFRPLYGTAAGPGLQLIETRAPEGRTGYLLREELDDALALDRGQPPLYRLNLALKEVRVPRGLRIDNVANRYELQLRTQYVLVELKSRRILTQGTVASNVTYDSADQPYAAVSAHQDGQRRIAADAAVRLRAALGTYFANPEADRSTTASAVESQTVQTQTDRLAPQGIDTPGDKADAQPGRDPVSQGPL